MKFALCRGVNDIGTGLQAVAAAITDPDTISAFQSEHRDDDMSHRTFYGGMHELAGGVDHAADGIQGLSQVLVIHETLSFNAALSLITYHTDIHCALPAVCAPCGRVICIHRAYN